MISSRYIVFVAQRWDTTDLEGLSDWDLIVYAQHYHMATRLLDWTTNPLVALWFAISDGKIESDGFLYILMVSEDMILDIGNDTNPFKIDRTRVIKPSINNERLLAQAGWFTAHPYIKKTGQFVNLKKNKSLKEKIHIIRIEGLNKAKLMRTLDSLGINQESLFPGLEGTCRYIDWKYRYLLL